MNNLISYLKSNIGICVALYLFLGLTEQLSNGYLGTHFIIKDLTDIFVWVFGQLTAQHAIDSKYNSPLGTTPK